MTTTMIIIASGTEIREMMIASVATATVHHPDGTETYIQKKIEVSLLFNYFAGIETEDGHDQDLVMVDIMK